MSEFYIFRFLLCTDNHLTIASHKLKKNVEKRNRVEISNIWIVPIAGFGKSKNEQIPFLCQIGNDVAGTTLQHRGGYRIRIFGGQTFS